MAPTINPMVPRHWLFGIAGSVWTAVGMMLCWRALNWSGILPFSEELLYELIGLVTAGVGYILIFSKVVRKNINRITMMPPRASVFAFTAVKGYIMILLMISLGLVLRNSSIPKHYLSIPYTAMGLMLLFGSVRFYTEYFALVRQHTKK